MLYPVKNKLCNAELGKPADWDESKGRCETLPVHREDDTFYSWYKFSWKDRIKVLFGCHIRLAIVAWAHPPVNLTVTKG